MTMTGRIERSAAWRVGGLVMLALLAGCSPSGAVSTGTPPGTPQTGTPDTTAPDEVPGAELSVDGGEPIPGELGTYVYGERGSDAPWLPATALDPVAAAPGAALEVKLSGGLGLAGGRAIFAAAADTEGTQPRGLEATSDGQRLRLVGPPAGSWVLSVEVDYPDGLGSGAYFWRLEVR
jgi:hypothetical protein